MTAPTYTDTIDWEEYWHQADETIREDTSPTADLALDPILEFLESVGSPERFADVGCGPGDLVFAVAETYSDATVVGYDAADAVLAENRERADSQNIDVSFERAVLPEFDPSHSFDVVTAYTARKPTPSGVGGSA